MQHIRDNTTNNAGMTCVFESMKEYPQIANKKDSLLARLRQLRATIPLISKHIYCLTYNGIDWCCFSVICWKTRQQFFHPLLLKYERISTSCQ